MPVGRQPCLPDLISLLPIGPFSQMHSLIHSFIEQIFYESPLHARHCSRHRNIAGSPPGTVSVCSHGVDALGAAADRHEPVMTASGGCHGGNGEQDVEGNWGVVAGCLGIDLRRPGGCKGTKGKPFWREPVQRPQGQRECDLCGGETEAGCGQEW